MLPFNDKPERRFWVFLLGGLLFTAAAFWPGLSGPFLFDDFGSLGDLGRYGGVDDWHTFKQFVFGGSTGPTGRPVSLLSFLIDGRDWPTDPWPFKRTNLVIHGANAILVGLLCRRMLAVLEYDSARAASVAAFCAIAWAAHPFLVSTVLYPVQRMAQLAAMFSLLGLNLYLCARGRVKERPRQAYLVMSAAIGACTLLATLSKENGALTPLMIGVLEMTIVASQAGRLGHLNRAWATVFIALPCAFVFAFLLRIGMTSDLFAQQSSRSFSTYERMLTETRILFDYLRHWFLPSLYTSGVFQDHIDKSTGLLQPVTTLVSLLGHAGLLAIAWLKRKSAPLFAFAVLFFYAGHLLESTVISLELYFEHRNYLPAAFLFLPLAALIRAHTPWRAAALAAALVLAVLMGFTRFSSGIWQSYPDMVVSAARAEPRSARAQQQFASLLYNQGEVASAVAVTERALELRPGDRTLNLWNAILLCRAGTLRAAKFDEIAGVLANASYDLRSLDGYQALIAAVDANECPRVTAEQLEAMFTLMLENPANANPAYPTYPQVTYLLGQVQLSRGDAAAAVESFERSLESRPGAGRAMAMAAGLASREHYAEAMQLSETALAYFGDGDEPGGMATGVTRNDIRVFQEQVRSAMKDSPADPQASEAPPDADAR